MRQHAAGGGKVMEVSGTIFTLGAVLDRVGPQRESISATSAEFDRMVKTKMSSIHEACKRDSAFLDRKFPLMPFHPGRRASFVYLNLLRVMAIEASFSEKGRWYGFLSRRYCVRILKLRSFLIRNGNVESQAARRIGLRASTRPRN